MTIDILSDENKKKVNTYLSMTRSRNAFVRERGRVLLFRLMMNVSDIHMYSYQKKLAEMFLKI